MAIAASPVTARLTIDLTFPAGTDRKALLDAVDAGGPAAQSAFLAAMETADLGTPHLSMQCGVLAGDFDEPDPI